MSRAKELQVVLNTMLADSRGIVIAFWDEAGKAHCLRGNMGRLEASDLLVKAAHRVIKNLKNRGDTEP